MSVDLSAVSCVIDLSFKNSSKMNTEETSSMHEEVLLSEDTDVLSGGTSRTNDPLHAVLQSLIKNMALIGESLRSLK